MPYSELANWDGSLTRREAASREDSSTQARLIESVPDTQNNVEVGVKTPESFTSPLSFDEAPHTPQEEQFSTQSIISIEDISFQENNFGDAVRIRVLDAPQSLSTGSGRLEVGALSYVLESFHILRNIF